jgi:predicted porin
VSNSLSGTISDNDSYAIMALYNFGKAKVFAGYEDIKFKNPDSPLPNGYITIGGYQLAYLNQTAYTNNKTLKVFWAGGKYALNDQLEFTLAYYGNKQDSFAPVECSNASLSSCEGELNVISALADYKFTKRFDAYLGTMWSEAKNGLANGYLLLGPSGTASTITSTVGVRFKF